MASVVLGKRTRGSTASAPVLVSPPHDKRQACENICVDEVENPFVRKRSRKATQDDKSLEVGTLSRPTSTKLKLFERVFTTRSAFNDVLKNTEDQSEDENLLPIQNPTPRTPRHRDALSKKVPVTPRHRVIITGKSVTPQTPRTPGGSITTVYSLARQLFTRSTAPGPLVGREAEREELCSFVNTGIANFSGGCLYMSGPPGTGKSAMVSEILATVENSATLQKAYINCMSMKTSKNLCGNLLESFCSDIEVMEGEEIKILQNMFVPRKRSKHVFIVVLDEIDHVLTLDLEILYKIFEWALQKTSRLILIGIANALDLTDRFLPRLKGRNLKPRLLPFLPYNATQIRTVITNRLKSLVSVDSTSPDFVPFIHPVAIDLCSRKVSSQTGDLRKAFDICRRAIDVIESETKQKHEQALNEKLSWESPSKRPLEEISNLSLPQNSVTRKSLADSLATLTIETAPRASIAHLNKITSSTFGNGANQRLKTLNIQQKAALCSLVSLENRRREAAANVIATPSKTNNIAPTIKDLYKVYCTLCKRDKVLYPLESTEFKDVIDSLETLSLVSEVDGRNSSFIGMSTPSRKTRKFGTGVGLGDEKRVASCVGEKELVQAVQDRLGSGILKSILSGEAFD